MHRLSYARPLHSISRTAMLTQKLLLLYIGNDNKITGAHDFFFPFQAVREICDTFTDRGLPNYPSGAPFTFWEQYINLRFYLSLAILCVLLSTFVVLTLVLVNPWLATVVVSNSLYLRSLQNFFLVSQWFVLHQSFSPTIHFWLQIYIFRPQYLKACWTDYLYLDSWPFPFFFSVGCCVDYNCGGTVWFHGSVRDPPECCPSGHPYRQCGGGGGVHSPYSRGRYITLLAHVLELFLLFFKEK